MCSASGAESFGSGEGERKTLLTRQIAFDQLPVSILLGDGRSLIDVPLQTNRRLA